MTIAHGEMSTTLSPRHGVVTLFGYGIKIHVARGHLIMEDGIDTHPVCSGVYADRAVQ